MNKSDIIRQLLAGRSREPGAQGAAYAPANIALCKYWGKRDEELNLPVTSSLSLSLGSLGAHTEVSACDGPDRVQLDGRELPPDSPFAKRLSAYLDLFRENHGFDVRTESSVPVAAGLASSASGFAALVLALNDLYGWELDRTALSILARLGSGSACRSIFQGFVEWHAGSRPDGMDSYAEPLQAEWPDLRLGLLELSTAEKAVGSRAGMKNTVETSALYSAWPEKVADDLLDLHTAIKERDFERLGRAAESNALSMHATMFSAWPPLCYWLPESVHAMRAIWRLRNDGLPLYFTMDAGPNLKLLFLDADRARVASHFPAMRVVESNERGMS